MTTHKTYFNWSSGKDAALALYHLQQRPGFHVDKVVTSVNAHYDRVSMHGLRRSVLDKQLEALGIASEVLLLPEQPTMEAYEEEMTALMSRLNAEGYTHTAFGDIFLEDLRVYREEQFRKGGLECVFPLWKKDTKALIHEFLDLGFKAVVVCIKAELLDASFVGRDISHQFLDDLPSNVDPCGENGEFHTFCYDGPIFKNPIKFDLGEKVYRAYKAPNTEQEQPQAEMGFWFQDVTVP